MILDQKLVQGSKLKEPGPLVENHFYSMLSKKKKEIYGHSEIIIKYLAQRQTKETNKLKIEQKNSEKETYRDSWNFIDRYGEIEIKRNIWRDRYKEIDREGEREGKMERRIVSKRQKQRQSFKKRKLFLVKKVILCIY